MLEALAALHLLAVHEGAGGASRVGEGQARGAEGQARVLGLDVSQHDLDVGVHAGSEDDVA
jgi:hypothetical protein